MKTQVARKSARREPVDPAIANAEEWLANAEALAATVRELELRAERARAPERKVWQAKRQELLMLVGADPTRFVAMTKKALSRAEERPGPEARLTLIREALELATLRFKAEPAYGLRNRLRLLGVSDEQIDGSLESRKVIGPLKRGTADVHSPEAAALRLLSAALRMSIASIRTIGGSRHPRT